MPGSLEVRWHAGAAASLFLTLLPCAVLFGIAGVRPSIAAGLAAQYRGGYIATGQDGRVNWLAAAIALYALGAAIQYGWRWADGVAVRADAEGLTFHPSTLRGKLAWGEVRAVHCVPVRWSGTLFVEPVAGRGFTVRMVDPHAGVQFAREVTERWLALPPTRRAM